MWEEYFWTLRKIKLVKKVDAFNKFLQKFLITFLIKGLSILIELRSYLISKINQFNLKYTSGLN